MNFKLYEGRAGEKGDTNFDKEIGLEIRKGHQKLMGTVVNNKIDFSLRHVWL